MSKVIALSILVSLAILPVTGNVKSTAATDTLMKVTIEFGGLMVFNQHNGSFEVGILPDNEGAHGHQFCIQRGTDPLICRRELEQRFGTRWSFIIENAPTATNTFVTLGHGNVRRPDHPQGQHDFDWIIHFDGPDFHPGRLRLEPGHLRPIIKLPKGEFFTKYKSHDLVRWKGRKPAPHEPLPPPFGFVSEAIGLRFDLNRGQRLVLRDDQSQMEIIAVPYMTGQRNYEVKVANVRPKEHRQNSDFRMYYNLFPDLKNDPSQQYDFDQNKDHPCPNPRPNNRPCEAFNLVPIEAYTRRPIDKKKRKDTCCSLWCTQVLLRNLNGNLQ